MTPRRAALLTAAYYAAAFATLGAYLPYWPVWLENWGLDRAGIGAFLGAATIARIAGASLLSNLADRFAVRRWTIALTSLLTAAGFLSHLLITNSEALLAATLLLAFVMAPQIPLGEALGLRAASTYGFGYATVRAAGSLGFLLANVSVGWALDRAGPGLVLWVSVGGFFLIGLLGLIHPGGGSGTSEDRARPGEAMSLLRNGTFRIFLAAAALCQASHIIFYVYSVLAWRDQGLSGAVIGWLWATGVIFETALMLGPGRRILKEIGPAMAIAAGAAAGLVRWSAMALEPGLAWLWPLQALHALTFALAHLGAMAFLAQAVPPRLAGSAQGLLSATGSATSSIAAMVAGATAIAWFGTSAGYTLAVLLSAASLAGAVVLARVWQGDRLALTRRPG